MKLRKLFLFLIFSLCINYAFACKCFEYDKEEIVKYGLKRYNMAFYGELIKRDTIHQTYSFKIIELLKGIYISKTIDGIPTGGNCGLFPDKKGLWIVYGNYNNDNKISLSMCSPTQSQDFGPGWPPPPEFKRDKFGKIIEPTETDYKINYLKYNTESLRFFIYQLEQLRAYKLSQNKISKKHRNTLFDIGLIISLIINVLLFFTIFYILVKKNIYFK